MRKVLFFALVVACWVLPMTFRYFPLPSVRWEGVWLITLFLGLTSPVFPGAFLVTLLALGQEAVAVPLHGPLLLSYLVVYFFLRLSKDHLFFEGTWALAIWVFLLTMVQKGMEGLLLVWGGIPKVPDLPIMVAIALLHAGTSLAFFPILKKIQGGPQGSGDR